MGSVLVVEDDPMLQEIVWFNLRLAGHTVSTAADGGAALDAIASQPPDAVVLDMMMPNLDGLSVLRALKSDPRTGHIPVVVVTARSSDADVWAGFQAGADHYLTKPVRVSALVQLVSDIVSGSGDDGPNPLTHV